MGFITKLFAQKKILILDIWTYKLKAWVCILENSKIKLISYAEKRQNKADFFAWEISDIEWLIETISEALDKIKDELGSIPTDVIINIPSNKISTVTSRVDYIRKSINTPISISELDDIIHKTEFENLTKAKKEIEEKTGYIDTDLKLVTSSITRILIDGLQVSNPVWFTWKNVVIDTLNIFIPLSIYNIIKVIAKSLDLNIISIVPLEFSIPKILEQTKYRDRDVLFIDVWNYRTNLTVQKAWSIVWLDILSIWINDLILLIQKKDEDLTSHEIIEKLDNEDFFKEEKQEFLQIWFDWVVMLLKEIIKDDICPHHIFLLGWWNNKFIQKFLKNIDLKKYWLKVVKNFDFIDYDKKIFSKYTIKDILLDKTNIWLLSQVIVAEDILNNRDDLIVDRLKQIVSKIGL
jgi:hypothetical protein